MTPTKTQLAIAAAVISAIIAGIVAGNITPTKSPGYLSVAWTGAAATANARCMTCDARIDGSDTKFKVFQDAGYIYATVKVCANPIAVDALDDLPHYDGIDLIRDSCTISAYTAGDPRLQIWLQGHASNPALCACGTPTTCEWLQPGAMGQPSTWVAAPKNMTFQPGQWRDKAPGTCTRKPCVELAGSPSMPAACL